MEGKKKPWKENQHMVDHKKELVFNPDMEALSWKRSPVNARRSKGNRRRAVIVTVMKA